MKNLLYLLLFIGIAAHGQVTDAAMKTQADYIGTHTFDPSRTKTLDYDLINNKVSYVGMLTLSGTNTYTYTGLGAFTSIPSGFTIDVKFPNDNTGASTLNINSIGAIPIVKGVSTALVAGDIKAGKGYRLFYDGTNFQLNVSNAVGNTGDFQLNLSGSFDATPNVNYNKTSNIFRVCPGLNLTGTNTRTDNVYLGLNHADILVNAGQSRWGMVIGEQHTMSDSSTATSVLNDDYLLGGFFNRIMVSTTGNNVAVSGIVGGTSNMINNKNGVIPFGAIILGGYANVISPSTSAIVRFRGNFILGGTNNLSTGDGSGAMGYWSRSTGKHSLVHGYVTTFVGGNSGNQSWPNPNNGINHTGTVPGVVASGLHAINISANSPHQTNGFGATGDYSGIFAGVNGNVSGKNSVVLGGYEVSMADSATVAAPRLYSRGGNSLGIVTVTTNTTINKWTHYTVLVDATSGNVTISLPAVASSGNVIFIVKKIDASANTVTIDPNASELIDGNSTETIISQTDFRVIHCDAAAWWITGR